MALGAALLPGANSPMRRRGWRSIPIRPNQPPDRASMGGSRCVILSHSLCLFWPRPWKPAEMPSSALAFDHIQFHSASF